MGWYVPTVRGRGEAKGSVGKLLPKQGPGRAALPTRCPNNVVMIACATLGCVQMPVAVQEWGVDGGAVDAKAVWAALGAASGASAWPRAA